jgi:hypothetical protein
LKAGSFPLWGSFGGERSKKRGGKKEEKRKGGAALSRRKKKLLLSLPEGGRGKEGAPPSCRAGYPALRGESARVAKPVLLPS